jgi:peptidoglycan/xylan/chitin deacetylase (PgdA/CDA1 family)
VSRAGIPALDSVSARQKKSATVDMEKRAAMRITIAALFALVAILDGSAGARQTAESTKARQMAVTVDDLPTTSAIGSDLAGAERTTRELVAALRRHDIPAIGFVNERKLYANGAVDPRRVALLQHWIDAGLELGNHTFSHPDLHSTAVEQFERDVLEGEKITRGLLQRAGQRLRFFRHPFLHTGRSKEVRARLDAFLAGHGYTVAPVTVDNYDYVFAAAYDRAHSAGDVPMRQKIADAYVEYMQAVVEYYERQSIAIVGRDIVQTLLVHANALNAAAFGRLARWLEARGYRFVSLREALDDPAYSTADAYFGPAGITWLHRWALTQGQRGAVFAGEPAVPDWIERASKIEK